MGSKKTHILFLMANNSSVPYFLWFAEKSMGNTEFKFSFVALNDSRPEMIDEMRAFDCECYWVPFESDKRKKSWAIAIVELYKLFKKIKPDVIHPHLFDDSVPALIAAKLAGIKYRFITKQDTTYHWFYAQKGVKFDKLNNYLATHIIAVSNECKQFVIEKEKANPEKLYVIHHGIPLDKLSYATEEYKNELIIKFNLQNKIVIGTVARLIEWKGHRILLAVAERIIKENPDIVFLFTGEGALKLEFEKIIQTKGLSNNVILTGYIEREKIPSLYSIMDIYIHAARYEPFGFVIAEAMLNGAPILSTKTGSALDAIQHKENGYLVDYDDVNGFVDGIRFLLNNDKKLIGEKGKQTAIEMYDFDKMWEGHISLYKKVISTK